MVLLRDFPGPAEGSLEDDWATIRGKRDRTDPVRKFTLDETARYDRLIQGDETPEREEDEDFGE